MDLNHYFKKLRSYHPISSVFIETLVKIIIEEPYARGEKIKINNCTYNPFLFLSKGAARITFRKKNAKKANTLEFIFSGRFIFLPKPNDDLQGIAFELEFMENSTVQSFPIEHLSFLIANHQETLNILFDIIQQSQIDKLLFIDSLANEPAEIRYKSVMENSPSLFSVVKQKIIASFLGMDSKTLSRIRAKERNRPIS